MKKRTEPLLAFYGDDFTGSTDALEFLSRAGARAMLFMNPPTPKQLAHYKGLEAIGIAGMTRTMTPENMEKELKPAFSALRALNAAHVHYKVCSTFDSSPITGSIGKAIDVGAGIFESRFVPLLVAAPALGRYCAFGNLFARMGIGSDGPIYRLDRHPSMIRHPVTPADESDLRRHLARQTSRKIGLMDILQVTLNEIESQKILEELVRNGAEVVLFDALREEQMADIGRLIDDCAAPGKSLFSVGSSGIEMALGNYWINRGKLQPRQHWEEPGAAEPLLVASGSCSPVTSKQIARALAQGFEEIALDTETIARERNFSFVVKKHVKEAAEFIDKGRSVVLHTCSGDADQRVEKTKEIFRLQGLDLPEIRSVSARLFGKALGRIVKDVTEQTSVKRIVFAGGDTSGFAANVLDIEAIEMIAPISPGAPLCRAFAPGSPIDGLEINFKGGQVGREDYFGAVLQGKTNYKTSSEQK